MQNTDIKLRRPVLDISLRIIIILAAIGLPLLYLFAHRFFVGGAITAIIMFFGFGLPRWIGSGTRNEKALEAKLKELEQWGFYSRDHEGPWINYIDYPLVKKTRYAEGKYFYSEWLIIHDGIIIVNPGNVIKNKNDENVTYNFSERRAYAWDGCTPKRYFFWVALFGTPDWWHKKETVYTISSTCTIVSREVFWQLAHHASLVHDALYQYLDTIPVAKRNVDRLFYEMLKESSMLPPIAKIYHLAVRFFGAPDIKENNPHENSNLKVNRIPGEPGSSA